MKIKELINILQELDPEGDVCVVDYEQNFCLDIVGVRTCDDHSSEWHKNYADIVVVVNPDG